MFYPRFLFPVEEKLEAVKLLTAGIFVLVCAAT